MGRGTIMLGCLVAIAALTLGSIQANAAVYLPSIPGLGGPKYSSGDTLASTETTTVSKALDSALKAASVSNRRSCGISVANQAGFNLTNPAVFIKSGNAVSDPADVITAGNTALKVFLSDKWSTGKTTGLLTYDLDNTEFKVVVLWSVPYSFTISDLKYNVKVYPKSYATGEHMYEQMTSYAGVWSPSGWETREEFGVKVKVTMTANIEAKVMVFVDSAAFDEEGALESNVDCSFNAKWFGSYCWRECHSGGWCWINRKCSSARDCQGPYPCYATCQDAP